MRTATLVLAALTALAAPVAAQQRVNETFASAPGGTVEISNLAGSVTVTAWDRNEIQVTGTLGRGADRLEVNRDPRTSVIRVIVPRNARNVEGSELQIRVPAGKEVTATGVSADLSVDGVRGGVSLRSTSGDLVVAGRPSGFRGVTTSGDVRVNVATAGRVVARSTSGDIQVAGTATEGVRAESVSGDVVVTATTAEVRAKTVSGDLRLQGVTGRVSTSTVSGNARIVGGRAQHASFESVSGDLTYEGEIARGGAFNFKSHSGNIELVLPRGSTVDFEVKTFSGQIRSDFGGDVRRTSQYGPGREMRHSTGSGGGLVRVETFSGTVRLGGR